MASYTMELKDYIEMWSQDTIDTMKTADVIEAGRPKLFDFDYPLYDANYKKDFETHFIRNFYMTEIGYETEGRFKFELENYLVINMPYWNKLFESELLDYDPLTNAGETVTTDKTSDRKQNDTRNGTQNSTTDGTSTGTSTNDTTGSLTEDNFNRRLDSDTPDERLQLTATDGEGVIEYASKIEEENANNSKSTTGHANGSSSDTTHATTNGTVVDTLNSDVTETGNNTLSRTGKTGSMTYAEMVTKHRETFLRIERDIFNEMRAKLFMLVY